MENGWIELALLIIGVFLLTQTFSYIKYLTTMYGAKYPLAILVLSFIYPIFATENGSYFTKLTNFPIYVVLLWFVFVVVRFFISAGIFSSMVKGFKRGQNLANYQIGGDFLNNESRNRIKKPLFAGAPPPPENTKPLFKRKEKNKSDTVKDENISQEEQPMTNSSPKKITDSTKRKACYNCRYWTGNRQPKGAAGEFIEYENISAQCAPGGGRQHTKVDPKATCNSFLNQYR